MQVEKEKPAEAESTVALTRPMRKPRQKVQANLAPSIKAAETSLGNLKIHNNSVEALISDPSVLEALKKELDKGSGKRKEFGHRNPTRNYKSQEQAKEHSRNIEKTYQPKPSEKKQGFFSRIFDRIKSAINKVNAFIKKVKNSITLFFRRLNPSHKSTSAISNEIANKWMSRSYLGESAWSRFSRNPPVITREDDAFMKGDSYSAYAPNGIYLHGTNHIAINEKNELFSGEADRRRVIAHEQLHYAAYLGGGFEIHWRGSNNELVEKGDIKWLHEGLTELHAQQLTRSHGHLPSSVSYGAETALSFYLQKIAGPDVLKRAYLSGDFTHVRRAVDKKLGKGTFDALIMKKRGAEALQFIHKKFKASGINYAAWDKNPILRLALEGIGG